MNENSIIEERIRLLKEYFAKIKIVDNSISTEYFDDYILTAFRDNIQKKLDANKVKPKNYDFYDLFAGAGGLSLGLESNGFDPKVVIDNYKEANETYLFNRPDFSSSNLISEDIRNVDLNLFKKAPLVVGGPPCQGFSNVNKQKKVNDDRNKLYKFFVKTVKTANPPIFLMENVVGILPYKEQIVSDFNVVGYRTNVFKLNTKSFGFPQNRERVFFLGIDKKLNSIHDELFSMFSNIELDKSNGFSLSDAIADLPQLSAKTLRNSTYTESSQWGYTFGQMFKNNHSYTPLINDKEQFDFPLLNHKSKFNNERDIEIYSLLQQGEKSDSPRIEHINPYANRAGIFKDKFYKLPFENISKTITAHMYYDCHMYIHPTQARGLTPREAARIQGFPDDYLFLGSPNEWYRQIGNAVSPILAKKIGSKIKMMLDRIYRA